MADPRVGQRATLQETREHLERVRADGLRRLAHELGHPISEQQAEAAARERTRLSSELLARKGAK